MKTTLLLLGLAVMMLACQEKQKTTDKIETLKTDSNIAPKEDSPAKPASDYAKLILGKWVMPEEDNGFQPWVYYDAEKVYSDGNEQGTEYEVKGDMLIYRVLGGGEPAEYKILTLNEKELTYQIDKDRKQTWTREQKQEAPKTAKKPTVIDAKLLVGTWIDEKAEDEFSKQRVYKSNGKVDMTPFNDLASYKVVGNKINYTNVANGGQPYEDVITSLTKTELVINGKFKFKRVK